MVYMDNTEIPEYFICPISLQIMKDPVTAATGITYDRESIEHWLLRFNNTVCPVTKQPLPTDSDLTPNHTLLRLINAWCAAASALKAPPLAITASYIENLIRSLRHSESQLQALQKLESLMVENEYLRKQVAESAAVVKAILYFIVQCHRNSESSTATAGLSEALHILHLIRGSFRVVNLFQTEIIIGDIIEALSWSLEWSVNLGVNVNTEMHAIFALDSVVQNAKSTHLKTLKPEFFQRLVDYVKVRRNLNQHGINAALQVMLVSTPWGRNRMMMVDSIAAFELIELELNSPDKRTTELILGVLYHLCECADGRAQFLSHAGGVAAVSRRILKLSPAADNRAVLILSLISKFSATSGVLQEMLRVGAVAKICMVVQSDCDLHVKDKAMEILRTHSSVWKSYPECVDLNTFTTDKLCR